MRHFLATSHQIQTNRGFTLIETLVYLALYSIIMTGALVSVYAIFNSSARNQTKAMVQEEGSFLVGKIDWALHGAADISLPADNTLGNTLSVTKYDTTIGNPVVIVLSGTDLVITRGTNPSEILNNSNVRVVCDPAGCFNHVSASGDGINPESLKTKFTLVTRTSDGLEYTQDFSTIKYLRR